MRKSLSTLFLVLITLALSVSSALAAPALANRNVTLQRVTYERGGITLLFRTSGLTEADLQKTSFTAHSQQWNMACNFASDTTLSCHFSKRLSRFAGESFHGTLAGIQFSGILPRARRFPTLASAQALGVTQALSACPDGQTLVYTFEYSNPAYQAEVWSDAYIDSNTFYASYGVYPEFTSTYTDNADTYYIYGYTTFTSGHGATPSDNWDDLVAAYASDGITIQKTGESCDSDL